MKSSRVRESPTGRDGRLQGKADNGDIKPHSVLQGFILHPPSGASYKGLQLSMSGKRFIETRSKRFKGFPVAHLLKALKR